MKTSLSQLKTWVRLHWPLFLAIGLALFIRIALRAELVIGKNIYSYQMAQDAWHLADTIREGVFHSGFAQSLVDIRSNQGLLRIVLNLPLTLIYTIFGFSRVATISYSLIAVAANIILIFNIARKMFDYQAGFIAALIWAVVPLDVLLGGTVSWSIPILTLALAASSLMTEAIIRRSWRFLLFAFLPIVLTGFYNLPISTSLLFIVGSTALWLIARTQTFPLLKPSRLGMYIIAVIALALFSYFSLANINALFSTLVLIIQSPGIFLHLVFFLVSLSVLYKTNTNRATMLVIWFSFALVGVAIAIFPFEMDGIPLLGSSLLFVFVPMIIAEGAYFSNFLKRQSLAWFAWILAAISLAFLAVTYGDHKLIPDYSKVAFSNADFIFVVAEIVAGLTIIVAVCSPAFFTAKPSFREKAAAFLLFCFLFAMLPAVWMLVSPFREVTHLAEEGIRLLQAQAVKQPVYFVLNDERDLYSFVQGLDDKQVLNELSLKKEPEGIDEIQNGYIVVPEGNLTDIPDFWVELAGTGYLYKRDLIYRALSEGALSKEIEIASSLVKQIPDEENLSRLFFAEMNARQQCEAVDTWMQQQLAGSGMPDVIPISDGLACFAQQIRQNKTLLDSLTPRAQALTRITKTTDTELATPVWSIYQNEFIYPDPRTFSFTADIHPNSFYLYTGWFKAKEEATVLYWQLDDWDGFISRVKIPSWTAFAALIYSGRSFSSNDISLFPALIGNYGVVYLSDIKFIEIP